MIIITSAAYVDAALASEFGRIPPSMLPVQNRRLYEHQLALIGHTQDVVISFPESYNVPYNDSHLLSSLGVRVVKVPDDKSLGNSILFVLKSLNASGSAMILHGDTLFSELPSSFDSYSVSSPLDNYQWSSPNEDVSSLIYTGCFAFSSVENLICDLETYSGDFVKSIEIYKKSHSVKDIELKGWLDFGLVNTYYRSCSKLTTQRAFNSMEMSRFAVRKSSSDELKMRAEANWISTIPVPLKHYVPSLWEVGFVGGRMYYEIEYLYLSSLASLFVFGENAAYVWKQIIKACFAFIEDEFFYKPNNIETTAIANSRLHVFKTKNRVDSYCKSMSISMDHRWIFNGKEIPSINEILDDVFSRFDGGDKRFVSLMHGDFCFSNILYDFKSQAIKTIDPRGVDVDKNLSIYGDIRYDIAKLAHSVLGLYDYIIAGRFDYVEYSEYNVNFSIHYDSRVEEIQSYFMSMKLDNFDMSQLSMIPITILLFFSMLPLHCDNPQRQKAMLANAFRLYVVYLK